MHSRVKQIEFIKRNRDDDIHVPRKLRLNQCHLRHIGNLRELTLRVTSHSISSSRGLYDGLSHVAGGRGTERQLLQHPPSNPEIGGMFAELVCDKKNSLGFVLYI